MRRIILTGSFLLALSSPIMAEQIYQWVDAAGQSNFGSQPPLGVQSTLISTGSSNKQKPATMPTPVPTSSATEDPQKAIDAKVKQNVAQHQAEMKKYCATLRADYAQLENNPRLMIQKNGETRRVTEPERQARISEAQKLIQENCN